MSHLHVPDGVLPIWLWLTGLIIAGAMISISLFMTRRMDLKKKVPLLGMMSAMMLVGMSLEIVPIAYHVNLSVITGVILGPWLAILAAFMVNFILSLAGHGGVTTVGLNTIIIGSEGVLGWLMFNALRKVVSPGASALITTYITLFISTCLMLFIVFIANVHLSSQGMAEVRDILETPTAAKLLELFSLRQGFNFRLFAIAAFGLGFIGWTIEAIVTSLAIKFISKVKPEIIGGA